MPEAESNAASWTAAFDNREKAEIALSRVYIRDFNHGTDGHSAKVIIAKMADLLQKREVEAEARLKDRTPKEWAHDAYNRYFVSSNGKTFDGRDMPTWEQLPEAIQGHWVAAIQGVI